MLKNYIKTAIRNLVKSKFYSLINITGLAVGLATCLLIWLYVTDELSFDRYNVHADRIYRANSEIRFGGNYIDLAVQAPQLGPDMVHELPEVENYTRLQWYGSFHVRKGDENVQEGRVAYADSTLFEVFTLPMIEGDPATALRDPRSLVITARMADKYFNRTNVVGQTLLINDSIPYKVTGVIRDIPTQSHFNFDFFVPMREHPGSRADNWLGDQNFNTYLLLRPGTDVRKLDKEMNDLVDRHVAPQLTAAIHQSLGEFKKSGAFIKGNLIPLTDIHLHSNKIGELDGNGNILYVYIFSAIALFILAIACVNFMNLSTARSANRAKEVGIRKVMGSLKQNLVFQFLLESIVIAFVALGLGLLLAYLALPYFDQLSGKEIASAGLFRPAMLAFLSFLILVVGILAGSYPAFVLAAFRPVEVLKGKLAGGFRRSWLRNALVVFQFATSIILIIGTLVIQNQMSYIRNRDVGYDRSQVMVIDHTEVFGTNTPAFRSELLHISGVRNASMTPYIPTGYWNNGNTFFTSPAKDPKTALNMHVWTVDEDYIATLGMKLESGRNFSSQFPTDSTGLIVNEAAWRFMGSPNIATKILYAFVNPTTTKPFHIIGVVKNFNFNSMREMVTPLCLMMGTANQNVSVRINAGDMPAVIGRIKQLWQKMAPGQPFGYSFLDDSFNRLYTAEVRTGRIALTFAVLAILIACLGLFGLVTFAVEQRTREIGIRKVLGADITSIVGMVAKDFLVLVAIASLIAFPVAAWAMSRWLQGFAYRVGLEWWIFGLAGVMAFLIALFTVGFRALNAALINPANTLRAE